MIMTLYPKVDRSTVSAAIKGRIRQIVTALLHGHDRVITERLDQLEEALCLNAACLAESGRYVPKLAGAKQPTEVFSDCTGDFWLWANTSGRRYIPELRDFLPSTPPTYNQLASASQAGDRTLRDGYRVYDRFRSLLSKHGQTPSRSTRLLDFGCGWGRVLRFFLRDIEGENLWGADMWDDQIRWARATNPYCHFETVAQLPPSKLPEGHFDTVVAFSVFSHLDEDTHLRWLERFDRLLAPGGLVVLTTWGRDRADFFDAVRSGDQRSWDAHYNREMKKRFPGKPAWCTSYDRGDFCHVDLRYEGNPGYGETAIPRTYATREWGRWFTVLEDDEDELLCDQRVIVARKR